jgi:hypothetical protein
MKELEACELPDSLKKRCQELSVCVADVAIEDVLKLTMDMYNETDDRFMGNA